MRNLVLIGFMGTGKSSVARLLARLLNFRYLDTDHSIERRAGRTITQIFAEGGEGAFRALEREVVDELGAETGTVISTGGGLGADPENLARLKQHAFVVCLWASPETIYERVRQQTHRPLLHDPDPLGRIQQLLSAREAVYRQADALVSTESRSVKEVAQHILREFRAALS